MYQQPSLCKNNFGSMVLNCSQRVWCTVFFVFTLANADILPIKSQKITEVGTHLCYKGFSGLCSGLLWGLYSIITWLLRIFLKITWFGEAFKMHLASSHPTALVSSACLRDHSNKTYLIRKGRQLQLGSTSQLCTLLMDLLEEMRRKLPLKETLVGHIANMMIFADGVGDMGNLQNRKTNMDSRYFLVVKH